MGRVQIIQGDDQSARLNLQRAIQADSAIPSAYEALSEIASREQHWSEAIHFTDEGLRLDTLHGARMWLVRSPAQYRMHDLNGAWQSALRGSGTDTEHKFPGLELVQAQVLYG